MGTGSDERDVEIYVITVPPSNRRRFENDLNPLFKEIELWPTYLIFQNPGLPLKNSTVWHRLRIFGDKIMGRRVK